MLLMNFGRKNGKSTNALLEATLLIKADRLEKRIHELADWDENFAGEKSINKKQYEKMIDAIVFVVARELKKKDGD